jgi:hypothetical protein
MTRTTLLAVIAALGLAASPLAGCGGPYKGPAEKLPRVKKSKAPEVVDSGPAQPVIVWNEECSAKFTEDAKKAKRSSGKAAPLVEQGNAATESFTRAAEPQTKLAMIIQAIEQYKKALVEDHYNAEATYSLAVAYAHVRRKGCALKMLKRLADLETNPRLAGGPARLESFLKQVEDEPAFQPFKNDAMAAIGR